MINENSSHRISDEGSDDSDAYVKAARATYERDGTGPICVVDGMGLNIHVDRNHLIITDGLGPFRRDRRFHRATHGLSRLVVLGQSGSVSLDALRYCDRLGIALVVIDAGSSRVSFTSTPPGTDDARLRRVQALAPENSLGVDIARLLLAAKLDGQARVLRTTFGAESSADTILTLREGLGESFSFDEMRQLEASAAACYFSTWSGSPLAVPKFTAKDLARIPDHWQRYDGRGSVLHSSNGNKKAERPVNAILNYLFALLEVEALLACHAIGIDPGMGVMHLDTRGRQSMALDLMEPVRPLVEQWTLEFLENRSFKRTDFSEADDGHVRLVAPLTHELADTMGQWRTAVAPWAERVAHLFGETMRGKYQAVTPLTKENHSAAQRGIRERKARESVYRELARAKEATPKQRPTKVVEVALRNCVECGGPLSRGRHLRCPQCWESLSGQDFQTRNKRGAAISQTKALERQWREAHPGERGDPEEYRRSILPGLEGVTLSQIMQTCGVAKSTASAIRSGKRVPAERHWEGLRRIIADSVQEKSTRSRLKTGKD